MSKVQLWVWVGNSETDTLDVLRYVKATEQDIASQQSVLTLAAEVIRLKEAHTAWEEMRVERDAERVWAAEAWKERESAVEQLDELRQVIDPIALDTETRAAAVIRLITTLAVEKARADEAEQLAFQNAETAARNGADLVSERAAREKAEAALAAEKARAEHAEAQADEILSQSARDHEDRVCASDGWGPCDNAPVWCDEHRLSTIDKHDHAVADAARRLLSLPGRGAEWQASILANATANPEWTELLTAIDAKP